MARHTVDQWNMSEDVQLSNVRGFSPLQKLPKLLQEVYPNLRPFTFGFFVDEDLPDRYADGWAHLTVDDFPDEDREALNTTLSNKGAWTEETTEKKKIAGLGDLRERVRRRFNIMASAEGWIMYKENYICIQPTDYKLKRLAKMHQISEDFHQKQVGPREEIRHDLGPVQTTYEETKVSPRRGRPPNKPRET